LIANSIKHSASGYTYRSAPSYQVNDIASEQALQRTIGALSRYTYFNSHTTTELNLNTDYLKRVFRWLHIVWAIIGSVACVLLATGKGHPPGLVFVPIAMAIWLVGHALLWLSRKLAVRGKNRADKGKVTHEKWPLTLIALVFLCGVVFIFGSFGIIWQVLSERNWIRELLIPVAIWVPSTLCFFGILLRRDWSQTLAGGGLIFVAVILLYEMIASFMRGYRNSATEWLTVIVITILLVLIGQHIFRSPRIKAFFARQ